MKRDTHPVVELKAWCPGTSKWPAIPIAMFSAYWDFHSGVAFIR